MKKHTIYLLASLPLLWLLIAVAAWDTGWLTFEVTKMLLRCLAFIGAAGGIFVVPILFIEICLRTKK